MRRPPDQLYRRLLAVLPEHVRRDAEDELVDTFRRSHARVAASSLTVRSAFWCRMLADLALTSGAEHFRRAPIHHRPAPPSLGEILMSLFTDLRLTARALRKTPAFTLTAVITLALGIGATTAIFSVVNSVLLAPLPYKEPSRLVIAWQELRARHVTEFPFPTGDIPDLKERGTLFEDVVALQTGRQSLSTDASQPEQVRTAFATPNVFRTLGLQIVRGRDFIPSDATPPPAQGVTVAVGAANAPGSQAPLRTATPAPVLSVILSHEFWLRHFGGDPAVVGHSLDLGGASATIVGVVQPGAQLLFPARTNIESSPDLWFASRTDFANGTRTAGVMRVIARLKPGATLGQAQAQMDGLAADLRQQYPVKKNAGVYIDLVSMQDSLVSDVRSSILALMGAVVFVFLIACANVANLLLTQVARRQRDLAVRAALGASRASLIRQVLGEGLILASLGSALGLGLARVGILALQRIGPATLPRLQTVAIDLHVLGFGVAIALVAACLLGVLPAIRSSRPDLIEVLRRTGRTAGLGAGRVGGSLVVVEVALSFVLLVGSGLLLRSLISLQHIDAGFDPRGVLTFFMPNVRAQGPDARAALVQQLRERILALPGVQGVAAATPLPLDGRTSNMPWGTEAAATDPTAFQQATVHTVQPGYFETMRARVIEGRTFQPADNVATFTGVVIDDLLAAKAFGGQSAVGRKLLLRLTGVSAIPFDVIGVVKHERHASLAEDGREAVFFADGQRGFAIANRWVIRTNQDPLSLAVAVKDAVAHVDPTAAVTEIQPMQALVDRAQAPTRFALVLVAVFAAIAAVLAAVGLYGILSTIVRQRTAEIGVRLALGAERSSIRWLIISRGLALAAVGVVVGAGTALIVMRFIRSLLVGVGSADPVTFVTIAVIFIAVATVACGLPAYRASRLDPTVALRAE